MFRLTVSRANKSWLTILSIPFPASVSQSAQPKENEIYRVKQEVGKSLFVLSILTLYTAHDWQTTVWYCLDNSIVFNRRISILLLQCRQWSSIRGEQAPTLILRRTVKFLDKEHCSSKEFSYFVHKGKTSLDAQHHVLLLLLLFERVWVRFTPENHLMSPAHHMWHLTC